MIAHVDLATGKIYGCKRGTWKWYHERGHLKFNELELSSNLKMLQSLIFDIWVLTITLSLFNKYFSLLVLPLSLIYLGINVYEEYWCNQYANARTFKHC